VNENIQNLFDFLFNSQTWAATSSGLIIGYLFGNWYHAKIVRDLRSDAGRLRADSDRLREDFKAAMDEAKEAKKNLAEDLAEYKKRSTEYEAEAESLKLRLKTLHCKICGSNLRKTGQYIEANSQGGRYEKVELTCTKPDCAHVVPLSPWEIVALMKLDA
jgi:hypothetical protein